MFLDDFAHGCGHLVMGYSGQAVGYRRWINHKECPADHKHQDGNGGFVDTCHAFDGDEEIADDEGTDDGNS